MNKTWVIAGTVALALALVATGAVVAQGIGRPAWAATPEPGYGPGMTLAPARSAGMGGGYGMMGGRGGAMMVAGNYGPMHEVMQDALADALGVTHEAFEERVANGETPYQIAQAQGKTQAEFFQIMQDARQGALDKLAAEGTFTQEQADWMLSRMANMGGRGIMMGGYGGGNPANCPHFNATPEPAKP